jgi:hypothetical protein
VSDGLLPLNPATIPGGQIEDVEDLIGAGATPVIRQRLQVTGAILAEVARVMNIDPTGTEYGLVVRPIIARSGTATTTQVNANLAPVLLLAANPARKQAMFQATSIITGGNLFLLFGASSIPTVELVPGAYYELPQPVFDGAISGVWDAAIGSVSITEQT